MSQKPTYYAVLPAPVRYDASLTFFQKILYAELTCLTEAEGYCWATNKYFADLYRVELTYISKQFAVLEKAGHITIDIDRTRHNQRKIYVLGIKTFKKKRKITRKTSQLYKLNKKQDDCTKVQAPIAQKCKHNNTSNNKSSKEDITHSANAEFNVKRKSSRRLPRILKKKSSDPKIKLKYKVSVKDIQLFNELVQLGAINHRKNTSAYNYTFNMIHSLLKKGANCPYADQRHISEEYFDKEWTFDEIIETFKFMKAHCSKPWTNIGKFIWHKPFNGNGWSPLVQYHKKMERETTGEGLEVETTRLLKGFRKLNINTLDSSEINRIVTLLNLYTDGYMVPSGLLASYPGGILSVFLEHVKSKLRQRGFKPGYMLGEKFVKGFLEDAEKRGALRKGNGASYY